MTAQRSILFITTSDNPALQARLASQTRAMTDNERDLLDIEVFTHVFDPDRFREYLLRAINPLVGGRPALDQIGTTRRAAVATTGNGGAVRVCQSDGTCVTADPSITAPGAEVPRWERLMTFISERPPAEQTQIVQTQIEHLMRALRALNVCPTAILRLRRCVERSWGYYAYDSDQYLDGVAAETIVDRLQPASYVPGDPGEWRRQLAASFQRSYGHAYTDYTFGAGDVLFGLERDYNTATIGCRLAEGEDARSPNTCYAPTGECHRVWFQVTGSLRGGRVYTPAEMSSAIDEVGPFDPYRRLCPDPQRGWEAPLYEPHRPVVGRWRLYVLPPLRWYWQLFFGPQPEFDGKSFAEWLLAQDPVLLIRTLRQENTRRNAAAADAYNVQVADLIGQGQVNAAQEQQRAERRRQEVEGYVQLGGETATAAATAINPIAGLIAGVGSVVARVIARATTSATARINVDVYGQIVPVFSQFAISESKPAFDGNMIRIGPPPGPTPQDLGPERASTSTVVMGVIPLVPSVVGSLLAAPPTTAPRLAVSSVLRPVATPPATVPSPATVPPPATPEESKTGWIVGGLLATAAVVAGGVILSRKQKHGSTVRR